MPYGSSFFSLKLQMKCVWQLTQISHTFNHKTNITRQISFKLLIAHINNTYQFVGNLNSSYI